MYVVKIEHNFRKIGEVVDQDTEFIPSRGTKDILVHFFVLCNNKVRISYLK